MQLRRYVTPPDGEHIVNHEGRDIDAGRVDAVAKFHRIVDLVDEETTVRVLEEIDRDNATTDRPRGAHADRVHFRRHWAIGCLAAARGIRDPVRRVAIDRADRLIADDESTDVPPA